MAYEIDIKVMTTGQVGVDPTRIIGYVNGKDVIEINNHLNQEWRVSGSNALPGDIDRARAVCKCFDAAFKKMLEVRGLTDITPEMESLANEIRNS